MKGRWVSGDGVVVERAFARALGVAVGARVELNGRSFPVVGIAVSAALPPYPQLCTVGCILGGKGWEPSQLGLVWATPDQAEALVTPREPVTYFQYLRLRSPASAPAFAGRYSQDQSTTGPYLVPWQEIAWRQEEQLANERTVVIFGSTLLVVLALATVTVLVAGRMAATPGFVTRLFLISYLAVASAAGLLGVVAGRLLAPSLVTPSAGLLGRLGHTSLSLTDDLIVLATNVAIVATASTLPAWRAARTSTVHALADAGRTPYRSRLLVRLSARLPVAALLGLRLAARPPRRALLTTLSISIAVCGSVAALYAEAAMSADQGAAGGPVDPHVAQLHTVLLTVVLLLGAMAAVNLTFIARTSAVDARRVLAVARTLGASPGEVAAGLGVAQVIPAVAGLGFGAIAGVLIFHALSNDVTVRPPLPHLAGLALTTLLVVVLLTALPARLEARRPVAVTLREP